MHRPLDQETTNKVLDITTELSENITDMLVDKMNEFIGNDPAVPMTILTVSIARSMVDLIGACAYKLHITHTEEVERLVNTIFDQIRRPLDTERCEKIAKMVQEETVQ